LGRPAEISGPTHGQDVCAATRIFAKMSPEEDEELSILSTESAMSNQDPGTANQAHLSRRGFLKGATAAALTAPIIIPASALGKDGRAAPSERIVMGCIGVGGRGTSNLRTFMGNKDVQIVAVADVEKESKRYYRGRTAGREPARRLVDQYYSKHASGSHKGCKAYKDFRDLVARNDIDAVSIATPDHWHAVTSVAAISSGKDVYCEKPLANSVFESRAVSDAAARHGRVVQTGSHERSNNNSRHAAELVRNGYIGKLKRVTIQMPCTEPHHNMVRKVTTVPDTEPVPAGLDYNFWLGHTPKVPYVPARHHFWWRFALTYGGGEMTDRGAHVIDLAQMAMATEYTGPVEIEAKGVRGTGVYDTFMDYEFRNVFANGLEMIGTAKGPRGLKLEGSDGWIFVHVHGCRLEASDKSLLSTKVKDNEELLGRTSSHHRNFLDCVKSRETPFATAEIGHRSGSICHLNNIAMLLGRSLKWDPKAEKFHDDSEANELLRPPMESGWVL
ncbi:MAG: Gfo/Idh/MocA family oxidoreductase, partial [Planctomycetota bacterium]